MRYIKSGCILNRILKWAASPCEDDLGCEESVASRECESKNHDSTVRALRRVSAQQQTHRQIPSAMARLWRCYGAGVNEGFPCTTSTPSSEVRQIKDRIRTVGCWEPFRRRAVPTPRR